ncbi:MAG: LacI family transcriptional regulator [Propionibacteriaceae bacterium]|jgi:DNA-binding LacI/PurR family transcriptional regulator|nr:LacI family transcriptional regulator [Propionibacteriaceae bacterium]
MPTGKASSTSKSASRVTIADIARRAGVTNTAVSLAINGKPGVSDETRERIRQIASDLRWTPNHAARALRGRGARAVGLVLARPEEAIEQEAFFARFITGAQATLSKHHFSLQLQMAADLTAEAAIHAEWVATGSVDGIIVLDPRAHDPRVTQLLSLGHPTIVVGGDDEGPSLASIRTDDGRFMRTILDHLIGLGHRRIGYVTGEQSFFHIRSRIDAFNETTIDAGVSGAVLSGDFSAKRAQSATKRLMESPNRPTAMIYDSELMAIAGLARLSTMKLSVPGDVSIVSWEDSQICQVLHPSLTTLDRDAVSLGRLAAADLLRLLSGDPIKPLEHRAAVIARESTAPPDGVDGTGAARR